MFENLHSNKKVRIKTQMTSSNPLLNSRITKKLPISTKKNKI